MTRKFVCLFLLTLFLVEADAAAYLYNHRQGLSDNNVTCIIKDKQGKLWVGTHKGLNTFDGYSFSIIQGLEGQHIIKLLYDSTSGMVWIAASSGLFVMDEFANNLIKCTAKIKGDNIKDVARFGTNIYAVFGDGRVLEILPNFSCRMVHNYIQNEHGSRIKINKVVSDSTGYVYCVVEDANNMIALSLTSGKKVNIPTYKNRDLWNIFSAQGSFVVNTGSTSISLAYASKNFEKIPYLLPLNRRGVDITCVRQYGDLYYVGFRAACDVYRLDTINHRFVLVEEKRNDYFSRSKAIHDLLPDGTNVLWIATDRGLVKQVVTPLKSFTRVLNGHQNKLSVRQIIKPDENQLFITTYDGMYQYSLVNDKVSKHSGLIARCCVWVPPFLYAGDELNKIPFYRVNLKTGERDISFYLPDSSALSIRSVFNIFHSRNNLFWLATDKGLATFNPTSGRLILHRNETYPTGGSALLYLCPNQDSSVLVAAGKDGIFFIDLQNQQVSRINHFTHHQLPDDDFLFCGIHPDGSYWFGTQSSGIVSVSVDLKQIKTYDVKKGLSANEVYSIVWVDSNEAWVTTSSGLNRFDLKRQTFDTYYYEDGIADDEFNQNSIFIDQGKIYAGGIDGITIFNPNEIEPRSKELSIFCSGITRWGNNSEQNKINDFTQTIEMGPQDYLLRFVFGLSDYSNTENNTYYYQIKGVHRDWSPLGNTNILNFEGLNTGAYELAIIGFNKFGNQSTNTLKFTIVVIPVYYKAYWFYGMMVLVLVLFIVGYYRWRLNMVHQRHQLRTKISSNLHDEVGSLLTSIIVSTENARYSASTVEDKDKRLKRISDLSRDAIGTMSDVLWSIDARNDKAGSFTDRMQEHAEVMFDDTQIEVRFNIAETNQKQPIEPDTRQQLYLIFKETMNNVLKHSSATQVCIRYAQKGKHFELEVENNCNNNTKQMNNSGQGIRNMRMRAEKIGAKLNIEQTEEGIFRVRIKR